jgi:pimeloyl-ACP methyl ester carboxylesterase
MATKDVSVVLTHGAWADGSSWARVITGLAAHGVKASAVPLPLASLADDVAALNRSIERVPGPVVLAAHAYAGAVIALARPERVKALVYVTALAPDEGEKVCSIMPSRILWHRSFHRMATGGSGSPKPRSRLLSRRMPPRRIWRCSRPCSARYRSTASLFRQAARAGRMFRLGSWWRSRIA